MPLFIHDDTAPSDDFYTFWDFKKTDDGYELGTYQCHSDFDGYTELRRTFASARVRSEIGGGMFPNTYLALLALQQKLAKTPIDKTDNPIYIGPDGDVWICNNFNPALNSYQPFKATQVQLDANPVVKTAFDNAYDVMSGELERALWNWGRFDDVSVQKQAMSEIQDLLNQQPAKIQAAPEPHQPIRRVSARTIKAKLIRNRPT